MDTKELYREMMRDLRFTVTEVEKQRTNFAAEMVKINDKPDSCCYCMFKSLWSSPSDAVVECQMINKLESICTTYDFLKYLLERI